MASRLRDISNTSFGTLNASKNKHLVRYDASTRLFTLTSKDNVLDSTQVLDGDLPDDFIAQIDSELNKANLGVKKVDGGSF